jgi:transcriptional regulator with XRE-family HTH domain
MNGTFHDRFREVRKAIKVTQKIFAESLGVDPSHVSQLESGKKQASRALIKLICLQFNINEEWLLSGKGEMTRPVPSNQTNEEQSVYVSDRQEAREILKRLMDIKQLNREEYIHLKGVIEGLHRALKHRRDEETMDWKI